MPPIVRLFRHTALLLDRQIDYLLAGDGVYGFTEVSRLRIPQLLLSCEVRGLPPLRPWLYGTSTVSIPFTAQDAGPAAPPPAPSYHVLTEEQPALPALDQERVYQYVLARQGLFLQATCTGLEMLVPIARGTALPGLASLTPVLRPAYPPVEAQIVQQLLARAQAATGADGHPVERLFSLLWEQGHWRLHEPEQEASSEHVRATHITPEHLVAFLEGHSHHRYAARFSAQDDLAEAPECRVYFVLGRIFTQPELRVRLCVHGYVWEVPAACFFTLPDGMIDVVAHEWQTQGTPEGSVFP